MRTRPGGLDGLVVVEPAVFLDERGFFFELFKTTSFGDAGLPTRFVQDNVSSSLRGVTRGLHFQTKPCEQAKLVTCLRGVAFDVAIDLRAESPTFGKWASIELTGENHLAVYIPTGFAHGFQALSDDTIIFYRCTSVYSPEHECGIRCDDPDLDIRWPLASLTLSPKDSRLLSFADWKKKNDLH